jgi:hypothetical protein
MNLKPGPLLVSYVAGSFLLAHFAFAQEDPLKDPDLQKMLKEAQELQKESGATKSPVKMSDLKKQADEIQEQQKQEELKEKAALQKQLAAPGPVALPGWTPATPQLHATGAAAKKIVDDEVRIVQTGTSPLTPKELGDAWEAAIAGKEINRSRNNITSNGAPTVVLFLSTRTEPREEVRMEASREANGKITEINISSPLPNPEDSTD